MPSQIHRFAAIAGMLMLAPTVFAQTTAAAPVSAQPITADLKLSEDAFNMKQLGDSRIMLHLNGMHLADVKPAAILKEPAYSVKPWYGAIRVGDGVKNTTYFAVDQATDGDEKIYIDFNQNGDLTDDGPGKWDGKSIASYRKPVFEETVKVHASWGTAVSETEGGTYSIYLSKMQGDPKVGFYTTSGRTGQLTLNGHAYNVMLRENTGDGLFTVPVEFDKGRALVDFFVDLDGDGSFAGYRKTVGDKTEMVAEQFNLSGPVQLNGQWYFVRPTMSGSKITLYPAAPNDLGTKFAKVADPLDSMTTLKAGTVAPDFTVETPEGKSMKLSDFKGKVVLIDFWATWCVPCQQSMPPLEKIYEQVKDQGVVVLSVNVLDEKEAFDMWIKKHSKTDYHFTFGFDPAGKDEHKSIASATYGVHGIPTMFVLDREGKIVDVLGGTGNEANLKRLLKGEGIKTE